MGTMLAAMILFLSVPGMLSVPQAGKQIVRVGPAGNAPFSPAVKAGGFVYLAGALATDESGRFAGGDIKAQTKRVLDNLSRTLQAGGSSLSNVASVNVYLKNSSDFQSMNEVYRTYWPKDPPARTTVAADLALPDALVEISMIAVPEGAERKVVHPQGWTRSPRPYSYGIKSGDTLFLAGLLSRSGKDDSFVSGDMTVQTRTVLDNAGRILAAEGMTLADVVSSRVYITDTAAFQDMNAAYRSYFSAAPPARATVRAGLMSPDARIEISLLAVKGPARESIATPNEDGSPGRPNPNLSAAIKAGNRLYLSGMLGVGQNGAGDIKAQTRSALDRIGRTLKAAGFDWKDVVDSTVYITDIGNFAGMNEVYRGAFAGDYPARATVGTGLMNPSGLVEIMFTAVK